MQEVCEEEADELEEVGDEDVGEEEVPRARGKVVDNHVGVGVEA